MHGVTTARARTEGQDYADGYREIRDALETAWALGHVLAIYNAAYDLTVINVEGLGSATRPLVVGPVIDPFVLDRHLDKYRKGKRTLAATCGHYGVRLDNAHSSDGNTHATLDLTRTLAPSGSPMTWEDITGAELVTVQAQWHKARQDSFRAAYPAAHRQGQLRSMQRLADAHSLVTGAVLRQSASAEPVCWSVAGAGPIGSCPISPLPFCH